MDVSAKKINSTLALLTCDWIDNSLSLWHQESLLALNSIPHIGTEEARIKKLA